jgi:CubicO group peptidase (beta-lactamase class C family)
MSCRILFAIALVTVPAFKASAEDHAAQVETGLRPRVQIRGEPETRWTIGDRQKVHNTPGVSVAVINNGEIEWAKAWGAGTTSGTRFQAASISKPVASVTALRLVAKGELSLDEDVNLKLKSWKVPANSWNKPVTLRQLLSHTAGLTVHGFPGYAAGVPVPSLVQLLNGEKPANTAPVRVDIEPGSMNRYSGGGYEVMQLLIEDVTSKPFATVAKMLVLDPVGMTNSTYEQPLPERLASTASPAHTGKGTPISGRWHTYPEQAAAGLWTTPTDLAKFLIAVQKAAAGDTKLLPTALTKEMLTVVKNNYALGWAIQTTGQDVSFSHGGANAGYRCFAWAYSTRGQGAVVMTNSDAGNALSSEIMRAIAAAYEWPDHKTQIRDAVKLTSEQLAPLLGEYEGNGAKLAVTARSSGGLTIATPMGSFDFMPESDTRFFPLSDGPPALIFEKNSDGAITGFSGGNLKAKKL